MKKTLTMVLLAGFGLTGCVAVPYGPAYGPEYGPAVYAPPVVVGPSIGIGFGYYGGRGYRSPRRHYW